MAGRRPNDTRERIKEVAQRLIAEHGVDGISIRDIITAAGQRNMASLYYYFRSKDELIKELVLDASKLMEGSRADHLARLEEIGEQLSVRQIVHVLISGAKLDPSQGGRNSTVMRFIGTVTHTHRHLFVEAIGDQYNRTFQRCLELLRLQLAHIPLTVLNQRLLFLSTAFTSLLVAREEGLNSEGHGRDYWRQPGTYLNLLDFMCGGLQAPVTPSELSMAQSEEGRVRHFDPANAAADGPVDDGANLDRSAQTGGKIEGDSQSPGAKPISRGKRALVSADGAVSGQPKGTSAATTRRKRSGPTSPSSGSTDRQEYKSLY